MKTFIKNILKTAFVALLLTGGASFAAAGTFDNNPANSSTRFVSIASNDSANSANQNDSFSVNIPNYGDTDEFTVFIDFRNEGSGTITNTRGKFNNITNLITNGTITGTLTGNNATNSGLNDQAYLQNLPQDFEIEFVNAYIENTHGTTDPQFCAGYNRNDPVSESQLFGSGANIGDLDDYQNGWCDQGYVVANFRIENTGQAPLNVEIRTNNATNVDENSAVLNGEVEDGNDVDVFFR
ncbi:MAG: hypothetical protein MRY57_03840, partial [Candidatus Pacebacteria bacterium]|nr:hypothetical protein [Candidatus Paceibacterota bacterium]